MEYMTRIRERVQKAINHIENNLRNSITIDELSRKAACSLYHFQRLFREVTDVSVAEYVRKRRLSESLKDLKETNKKVIEIAFDYQYSTHESFSKAFQKHFLLTPKDYRKSNAQLSPFQKIELKESQLNLKGKKRSEDMIFELKPKEFYKVTEFFKEVEVLNAQLVLNKFLDGRVFVDNVDNPKTAIVNFYEMLYIGGDVTNKLMIEEVNEICKAEVSSWTFMLAWSIANNKNPEILKDVLGDPMIYDNFTFEMTELKYDWRSHLLDGIEVHEITKEMLEQDYQNIDRIKSVVKDDFHNSEDEFLEKCGGFCLVKGNSIVSYALLDYNDYSNHYTTLVVTPDEYRRKGYGSIIAAAASESCLVKGSKMLWVRPAYDEVQIKMAKKLGYNKVVTSKIYYTYFDKFISCEEQLLKKINIDKNYEEALELIEQMYKVRINNDKYLWIGDERYGNKKHSYCTYHLHLYRIHTLGNEKEKALENITKAIELGKKDPEQLEYCYFTMEKMLEIQDELAEELKKVE